MSTLLAALQWLQRGISTIPAKSHSKYPILKWNKYQKQKSTLPELLKWFGLYQKLNLAVVCGPVSNNLMVIDFDNIVPFIEFRRKYLELCDTYTVQSARGFHLYYFCEDPPRQSSLGPKIDVKSSGYVLAPPSIHPNGSPYKIIHNADIMRIEKLPVCYYPPSIKGDVSDASNTPNTRWKEDIISKIKSLYRITNLFPYFRLSGNGMAIAHCPMSAHKNGDRHPSLSLDLNSDRCQCLKPDCSLHSRHGNSVIDAYMIVNNLPLKQALAEMAKELGL